MKVITNSVTLAGRVSKYKEMKYFESGGAVCTIGLGVKRGEKWHNFFIDFFNTKEKNIADTVGDQIKEGDYIQIKGRLSENKFTPKSMEGQVDENGQPVKVSQIKINAYDFKRIRFNEELEEFEYIEE